VIEPGRSASRVSIVTPVFNPPEAAFEACIASVLRQSEARWEWCLVDDCSTSPFVRRRLGALAASEPRVRVDLADVHAGIVATTNRALAMATGDVVVFLDDDDELADIAVDRVLSTFAADPSIGITYSDEYLIDEEGCVLFTHDKPDFSPERLRSHNYFAHLVAVTRAYTVASGGLRDGFDGAEDNDFVFRAVEHFGGATHIPERLYRWRAVAGSVADDPAAKPSTLFSAERALRDHLERVGIDATTTPAPDVNFSFRLHRTLRGTPLVSFIVRTDDGSIPPFVGDAIREGEWSRVEVVVADGRGPAVFDAAVREARGELVVVVDGDIRLARGDVIRDLLPLAQDDDVAAVGPSLLLPDGRLAASGIALDERLVPIGRGSPITDVGPWGIYRVTREVGAVPAVCFAARREVFLDLGGLSSELPDEVAAADYGMRARRSSRRLLVSPYVVAVIPWSAAGEVTEIAARAWAEHWERRTSHPEPTVASHSRPSEAGHQWGSR
jgi:glycosyltransferase involved in cell wall biosynthesis